MVFNYWNERRMQTTAILRNYVDAFNFFSVTPNDKGETRFVDREGMISTQSQIEATKRYSGFVDASLGLPPTNSSEDYSEGYTEAVKRKSGRLLTSGI